MKKNTVEPAKTTIAAAAVEDAHTTDATGAHDHHGHPHEHPHDHQEHPHDHHEHPPDQEIHLATDGSKFVLPVNHNVADKKLQKQLEEAEKEIAKKLAIMKAENEGEDSQHSICIAPPPPANKMSTVEIFSVGVSGYRKILMGCAVLLFLAAVTQFVVLFVVITIWPMGFAGKFEVEVPFLHKHILLIIVAISPVLSLAWLISVIFCGRRSKVCSINNDTYCCIRGYYAYSPVLLLIPLVSFITYILFVGRLDQEVLESVMMHALNTYDAVNKSREAWDATQTHFKCCGVDHDGWRNWEMRDMVREDVGEWKVPSSCCKIPNKKKCMYDTNDDFVHNEGCETKVFSIYALYGNLVICTLLAVIIVDCISIYFCTRYYAALRRREEDDFEFHVFTYIIECGACCRRCNPVENLV